MKFTEHKTCFDFLYKILPETFLILRTERDTVTTVHLVFMKSTAYCQSLIELEFPRQILKKYSDTKFNESPSSGSLTDPRTEGRTDRQT